MLIIYALLQGITGQVKLDDNADRDPNYWLWMFNPEVETFQFWTAIEMTREDGEVVKKG